MNKKINLSDWTTKENCSFLDYKEYIRFYHKDDEMTIVCFIRPSNKKEFSWSGTIWSDFSSSGKKFYSNNLELLKFKVDLLLSEVGYSVSKLGA